MSRIMWAPAVLITALARAHDAWAQGVVPVPCRDTPCAVVLDWGPGKTAASYPPDRRYGAGDDFEPRFKAALRDRGYRIVDGPTAGAVTMTLRPAMRSRVACDRVTGLNPDLTCTAMEGVTISFANDDATVKVPSAIRVNNRCGGADTYLAHRAFADFAAATLWWEFEGRSTGAERPRTGC